MRSRPTAPALAAALVFAVHLAACTALLDPDGLQFAEVDAAAETVADADADADADSAPDADADTAPDADADTAPDADADATPDADADATPDADADAAPDLDAGPELPPDPVVVVDAPTTCQPYFVHELLGCPKTCPDPDGWRITFDASASQNVTEFAWDISVSASKEAAFPVTWETPKDQAVATVRVGIDGAALLGDIACGASPNTLDPVYLTARLTVNGVPQGPVAEVKITGHKTDKNDCSVSSECSPE